MSEKFQAVIIGGGPEDMFVQLDLLSLVLKQHV